MLKASMETTFSRRRFLGSFLPFHLGGGFLFWVSLSSFPGLLDDLDGFPVIEKSVESSSQEKGSLSPSLAQAIIFCAQNTFTADVDRVTGNVAATSSRILCPGAEKFGRPEHTNMKPMIHLTVGRNFSLLYGLGRLSLTVPDLGWIFVSFLARNTQICSYFPQKWAHRFQKFFTLGE